MYDTFCIMGSLSGCEAGQQDCGSCYQITLESVIAIVSCDVILTILITVSVFCVVTLHKRREREPHSGKRSVSSSSKKIAAEVTESPYQELHGVQSDVYSELQRFRK